MSKMAYSNNSFWIRQAKSGWGASGMVWWLEEPTRPDFVVFWPALNARIGIFFEEADHNEFVAKLLGLLHVTMDLPDCGARLPGAKNRPRPSRMRLRCLWNGCHFSTSGKDSNVVKVLRSLPGRLTDAACYAA